MSLFIANTTKQHHEFMFWVPEQRRYFTKLIRAGGQEQIYPEGTRDVHEGIIAQHRQYGIKALSEIDRTKEFVGLCYQFDHPIPADRLTEAIEHNDDVMVSEAQERRKEATAALNESLTQVAQDSGTNLSGLDVEVVEEQKKGVDTQVNETISVNKPGRRGGRRGG
jgi:hypothetical protein